MRNVVALVIAGAFACSSLAYAESETEKEVKQAILEGNEYTNKNLAGRPDDYSQHGALEYWSSGGLLHNIAPGGRPEPFEVFNIEVKHIKVITLVEGQAAVAHYYSEGSMKPGRRLGIGAAIKQDSIGHRPFGQLVRSENTSSP